MCMGPLEGVVLDYHGCFYKLGGSFKREFQGSFKGFGGLIHCSFRVDIWFIETIWLFLHIGGPFCGCPYRENPAV